MVHIIVGLVAIILGVLGLWSTWLISLEVLKLVVFCGLVGVGVIAFLAGIRQLRGKAAKG